MDAIGIVEMFGYVCAIKAAKTLLRSGGDVKIIAIDSNKPARGNS